MMAGAAAAHSSRYFCFSGMSFRASALTSFEFCTLFATLTTPSRALSAISDRAFMKLALADLSAFFDSRFFSFTNFKRCDTLRFKLSVIIYQRVSNCAQYLSKGPKLCPIFIKGSQITRVGTQKFVRLVVYLP